MDIFIDDIQNSHNENEYDNEMIISKEKIIKTILNPDISLEALEKMSKRDFLDYADINDNIRKTYRTDIELIIRDVLILREKLDSILYGNTDLDTMTINDIFDKISYLMNTIPKKFIRAYIITIISNIKKYPGLEASITKTQSVKNKYKNKLATVENVTNFLTIIVADKDHFYVIGKNLSKYRAELLKKEGIIPKKRIGKKLVSRLDVVKFENRKKKEIKQFIIGTFDLKLKNEYILSKYIKRKYKIYLDASLLYLKYWNLKEEINYKIIIIIIRDIYKCNIPPNVLKEEEFLLEMSTAQKSLDKLSSKEDFKYKISKGAFNLLNSVIVYQISTFNQKEDIGMHLEEIDHSVLSTRTDSWFKRSADALINIAKSIHQDSKITCRLLDFSLSFIIYKPREDALKYLEEMREQFRNLKGLKINDFLISSGILWNTKPLRVLKFDNDSAFITMVAAIQYLVNLIKKDERIKLRINVFSS